jgi:hypothetical protein
LDFQTSVRGDFPYLPFLRLHQILESMNVLGFGLKVSGSIFLRHPKLPTMAFEELHRVDPLFRVKELETVLMNFFQDIGLLPPIC